MPHNPTAEITSLADVRNTKEFDAVIAAMSKLVGKRDLLSLMRIDRICKRGIEEIERSEK